MNLYKIVIGESPIMLTYFCVSEDFGSAIEKILTKVKADGFGRLQETNVKDVKLLCTQSQLVGIYSSLGSPGLTGSTFSIPESEEGK